MEHSGFLESVVAFVCAEDPGIKAEVERLVQFYGGTCLAAYDPAICTHIVAAATTLEDPTCHRALEDGKTVYSDLWLKSCIQEGRLLPLRDALHRPPVSSAGIPGAEGIVLCLTGFTGETRKELQFMAELIGVEFSKPLKVFHVTHLLCYDFIGDKYEVAKARGIHTVNKYWLEDCYLSWSLKPEVEYARSTKEVEEEKVARQSLYQKGLTGCPHGTRRAPPGVAASLASEESHPGEQKRNVEVLIRCEADNVSSGGGRGARGPDGAVARSADDGGPGLTALATDQKLHGTAQDGDLQSTNRPVVKEEKGSTVPHTPAVNGRGTRIQPSAAEGGDCRLTSADMPPVLPAISGWGYHAVLREDGPEQAVNYFSQAAAAQAEKVAGLGGVLAEMNQNCPAQELHSGRSRDVKAAAAGEKVGEGARGDSPAARRCDTKEPEGGQEGGPQSRGIRAASTSGRTAPLATAQGEAMGHEPLGGAGGGTLRSDELEAPLSTFETARENLPSQPSQDTADAGLPCGAADACPKLLSHNASVRVGGGIKPQGHPLRLAGDAGMVEAGTREKGGDAERSKGNGAPVEAPGSEGAERAPGSHGAEKPPGGVGEGCIASAEMELANLEVAVEEENGNVVAGEATDPPTPPPDGIDESDSKGKRKKASKQPDRTSKRGRAGPTVQRESVPEPSARGGPFDYLGTQEQASIPRDRQPKRRKAGPRSTCPPILSSDLELGSPASPTAPSPEAAAQGPAEPHPAVPPASSSAASKGRKGRSRKTVQPVAPLPQQEPMHGQEAAPAAGKACQVPGQSPAKGPGALPQKLLPKRTSATSRGRGRAEAEWTDSGKKAAQGQDGEGVRRFTFGGLAGDRERDALKKLAVRLGAKVCAGSQAVDEKQWDKRVTHLLLGAPLKRTEKLLGATAAGRWVLRPSYLKDSAASGRFLDEGEYEWSGAGLNEDGTFDLAAPKHWRELRDRTGMRAFERLHVGLLDSVGPHLGVLERTISGAGGIVHLVSCSSKAPNLVLAKKIHFLVMPADESTTHQSKQVGAQWKALGVPCVAPQYFLDYIAKPWSSLDAHVLLDTHEAAIAALCALRERVAQGMAEAECDVRMIRGAAEGSTKESMSEGESLDLGGT